LTLPTLTARYETRYRPVSAGVFHIVTRVTAPEPAESAQRPPINVSFVVDRSGSMAGGKLELVRRGVEHAVGLLGRADTFSLVVYDDRVDVITDQRAARRRYRAEATERLSGVQPRGMTALADGWATGCQQLAPIVDSVSTQARPICRALLLTDGLANVGETDPVALATHAAELRARGIATSTFGVGSDFDDALLGALADSGGGQYHYIPNAAAIPAVFAGELGELLRLGARNVYLTAQFPSAWRATNLNGLEEGLADHGQQLALGDLMAGEGRTVVWRCELPAVDDGTAARVELRLSWCDADGKPRAVVALPLEIEARRDPGQVDQSVLDEVALLVGAQAREEAVWFARAGRHDLAQHAVARAQAAMPSSPGGVAEVRELSRLAQYLPTADEADYKELNYQSRRRRRNQRDYRGTNE
jgi:Ca-activated chloride channel family protein